MKYFIRKVIAIILVIGLFQLLNNWWYRLYYGAFDLRHAPTVSFPIINTMFKEEAALEYVIEKNIDDYDIYIEPIDIERTEAETMEEKVKKIIENKTTKQLVKSLDDYEYNPVFTINYADAVETVVYDDSKEKVLYVNEDGAEDYFYPERKALTNDYTVDFILFERKYHYAGKYFIYLEEYEGE